MEQPDQPKQTTPDTHPVEVEVWELSLARYWRALRQGEPLPTWGLRTKANRTRVEVPLKDCVVLGRREQAAIRNSPLSPEFYEIAHGVDRWVVRDIRRRG